jgi:hypothetical protein
MYIKCGFTGQVQRSGSCHGSCLLASQSTPTSDHSSKRPTVRVFVTTPFRLVKTAFQGGLTARTLKVIPLPSMENTIAARSETAQNTHSDGTGCICWRLRHSLSAAQSVRPKQAPGGHSVVQTAPPDSPLVLPSGVYSDAPLNVVCKFHLNLQRQHDSNEQASNRLKPFTPRGWQSQTQATRAVSIRLQAGLGTRCGQAHVCGRIGNGSL